MCDLGDARRFCYLCTIFVRKKKNKSGTISVVVDKRHGFKEVKNFGVVTTDEEAEDLVGSRQECSGGLQITCRGYIPRCGLIATSGLGFINYIEVATSVG